MNKFVKLLLAICFIPLLLACSPTDRIIPVKEVETIVVSPSTEMTKTIPTPKPKFTPQEFAVASCRAQHDHYEVLIGDLYLSLETANVRLTGIAEWVMRQEKLYDKKSQIKGVQNE